jgi:MFS superfamily sulfate permease-like transporter
VFQWVPGLQVISSYRRQWLLKDVIAGVVLTTLLVPQGMAYAELAGLPPITGLYTSILCLLGYAVFGPSRILVLGPDSSLGPMIAVTILSLMAAKGDAKRAVALASILAIMVAAIMILAAVAKLGFIADLISKPTAEAVIAAGAFGAGLTDRQVLTKLAEASPLRLAASGGACLLAAITPPRWLRLPARPRSQPGCRR